MKFETPKHIEIKEYNYELPDERIAKYPLAERDASKLLVYRDLVIEDKNFKDISDYIPEDSLMVFNNTKVIQARMYFKKATGAQIEIFCLDPYLPHDYNLIFQTTHTCSWYCMVGNQKKWKEDSLTKEIEIEGTIVILTARKLKMRGNTSVIEFEWDNEDFSFADLLEAAGELPIPPYLNRETEDDDKERYQTLYSKIIGSVAAPTAGLHFTDEVMAKLKQKAIAIDEITLHVGAGTFKPVKSDTIGAHEMHSEFISVTKQTIENLLNHKGNIVAVGTTSVRTLESLYYIGLLLNDKPNVDELKVKQWQPYETQTEISKQQALKNILDYLNENSLDKLLADTQIMIVPGYRFKIVDAIITNFHQPQSTLLLLVSAFVGGNWKTIYDHALAHNYRFLSYGDSSLLFNQAKAE